MMYNQSWERISVNDWTVKEHRVKAIITLKDADLFEIIFQLLISFFIFVIFVGFLRVPLLVRVPQFENSGAPANLPKELKTALCGL